MWYSSSPPGGFGFGLDIVAAVVVIEEEEEGAASVIINEGGFLPELFASPAESS